MKTLFVALLVLISVSVQAQTDVVTADPPPDCDSWPMWDNQNDEFVYKCVGEGMFFNESTVDAFDKNYYNLYNIPDIPTWNTLEKPYWISVPSDYMQALVVDMDTEGELKAHLDIPTISTQSHINDASTNAPTNLNALTVQDLIDELNAANSRYNDLATKFNALLSAQEINDILEP